MVAIVNVYAQQYLLLPGHAVKKVYMSNGGQTNSAVRRWRLVVFGCLILHGLQQILLIELFVH